MGLEKALKKDWEKRLSNSSFGVDVKNYIDRLDLDNENVCKNDTTLINLEVINNYNIIIIVEAINKLHPNTYIELDSNYNIKLKVYNIYEEDESFEKIEPFKISTINNLIIECLANVGYDNFLEYLNNNDRNINTEGFI